MLRRMSWLGVIVCAALIAGCEKKETAPSAPTAPRGGAGSGARVDQVTPPAAPADRTMVPPTTAPAGGMQAPAMSAEEANTQIQQVMTYIKDKKYDLAETALQKLEQNKASLPASVQAQLPTARTALNTAKATGGGAALPSSVPAVPGLGR